MFASVGWTWNPCVGCTHDCPYCYAKRFRAKWGQGFKPEFRMHFLRDKLPDDDSWIFIGSMGDLFCDGFDDHQIGRVLDVIELYEGSCKFLLQTKNPGRFFTFINRLQKITNKIILGTTIETNLDTLGRAPGTMRRWEHMTQLKKMGFNTFLSLEPLADFDVAEMKEWIADIQPEAIEIGLENYTSFTNPPPESKILLLIDWLKTYNIPFVLKENLKYLEGTQI